MIYLLYNPLSKQGKCYKACLKLEKKLKKKSEDKIMVISLIDLINNADFFVSQIKEDDRVYIVGGDGTLHHIINYYDLSNTNFKLFYSQGGSGNDFCRGRKKKKLFEITDEIKNLPKYIVEGQDQKQFVNGVGLGIDADICVVKDKDKSSYVKATLKCLRTYKPYSIDLDVDGKKLHYDNVCFFTVMNGKYMGGGMKMAPKANRYDDHLDLVVITIKKPRRLIALFPTVFLGIHPLFKKIVHIMPCKLVKANLSCSQNLQSDGEVTPNVQSVTISIN